MELRLQVNDDYINRLQSVLGLKGSEVAREALTILNWAVQERLKGRVILSADSEGRNVARLAMPSLEKIAPWETAPRTA